MKRFDVLDMAHGGLSLVLEPSAAWGEFRHYAEHWADVLGAERMSDAVVTFDECLLDVRIRGGRFWITYDDFQASIQLEPRSREYNDTVLALQASLRKEAE